MASSTPSLDREGMSKTKTTKEGETERETMGVRQRNDELYVLACPFDVVLIHILFLYKIPSLILFICVFSVIFFVFGGERHKREDKIHIYP